MKRWIPLIALIIGLNGCMSQPNIKQTEEAKYALEDGGGTIGYAYLKDGIKLLYVSKKYEEPKDDSIEIVAINENGYYPDYYMSEEEENGKTIYCSMADWKNEEKGIKEQCDSAYTTHSTANVLLNIAVVALGDASNAQAFDKEYFLKVMQENHLDEKKKELLKMKR